MKPTLANALISALQTQFPKMQEIVNNLPKQKEQQELVYSILANLYKFNLNSDKKITGDLNSLLWLLLNVINKIDEPLQCPFLESIDKVCELSLTNDNFKLRNPLCAFEKTISLFADEKSQVSGYMGLPQQYCTPNNVCLALYNAFDEVISEPSVFSKKTFDDTLASRYYQWLTPAFFEDQSFLAAAKDKLTQKIVIDTGGPEKNREDISQIAWLSDNAKACLTQNQFSRTKTLLNNLPKQPEQQKLVNLILCNLYKLQQVHPNFTNIRHELDILQWLLQNVINKLANPDQQLSLLESVHKVCELAANNAKLRTPLYPLASFDKTITLFDHKKSLFDGFKLSPEVCTPKNTFFALQAVFRLVIANGNFQYADGFDTTIRNAGITSDAYFEKLATNESISALSKEKKQDIIKSSKPATQNPTPTKVKSTFDQLGEKAQSLIFGHVRKVPGLISALNAASKDDQSSVTKIINGMAMKGGKTATFTQELEALVWLLTNHIKGTHLQDMSKYYYAGAVFDNWNSLKDYAECIAAIKKLPIALQTKANDILFTFALMIYGHLDNVIGVFPNDIWRERKDHPIDGHILVMNKIKDSRKWNASPEIFPIKASATVRLPREGDAQDFIRVIQTITTFDARFQAKILNALLDNNNCHRISTVKLLELFHQHELLSFDKSIQLTAYQHPNPVASHAQFLTSCNLPEKMTESELVAFLQETSQKDLPLEKGQDDKTSNKPQAPKISKEEAVQILRNGGNVNLIQSASDKYNVDLFSLLAEWEQYAPGILASLSQLKVQEQVNSLGEIALEMQKREQSASGYEYTLELPILKQILELLNKFPEHAPYAQTLVELLALFHQHELLFSEQFIDKIIQHPNPAALHTQFLARCNLPEKMTDSELVALLQETWQADLSPENVQDDKINDMPQAPKISKEEAVQILRNGGNVNLIQSASGKYNVDLFSLLAEWEQYAPGILASLSQFQTQEQVTALGKIALEMQKRDDKSVGGYEYTVELPLLKQILDLLNKFPEHAPYVQTLAGYYSKTKPNDRYMLQSYSGGIRAIFNEQILPNRLLTPQNIFLIIDIILSKSLASAEDIFIFQDLHILTPENQDKIVSLLSKAHAMSAPNREKELQQITAMTSILIQLEKAKILTQERQERIFQHPHCRKLSCTISSIGSLELLDFNTSDGIDVLDSLIDFTPPLNDNAVLLINAIKESLQTTTGWNYKSLSALYYSQLLREVKLGDRNFIQKLLQVIPKENIEEALGNLIEILQHAEVRNRSWVIVYPEIISYLQEMGPASASNEIPIVPAALQGQNSHLHSVQVSVANAAVKLKERYGEEIANDVQKILDDISGWLDEQILESKNKDLTSKLLVSQRGFTSMKNSFFMDARSKITLREMFALAWLAIHDDKMRLCENIEDAFNGFVNGLYEAQRDDVNPTATNPSSASDDADADNPTCARGWFNKMIDCLQGVHPDCELIIITHTVIAGKLEIYIRDAIADFLADEPKRKCLEYISTMRSEGSLESIWKFIRDDVRDKLFEEFDGKTNQNLDNYIQQAIYIDIGKLKPTLAKIESRASDPMNSLSKEVQDKLRAASFAPGSLALCAETLALLSSKGLNSEQLVNEIIHHVNQDGLNEMVSKLRRAGHLDTISQDKLITIITDLPLKYPEQSIFFTPDFRKSMSKLPLEKFISICNSPMINLFTFTDAKGKELIRRLTLHRQEPGFQDLFLQIIDLCLNADENNFSFRDVQQQIANILEGKTNSQQSLPSAKLQVLMSDNDEVGMQLWLVLHKNKLLTQARLDKTRSILLDDDSCGLYDQCTVLRIRQLSSLPIDADSTDALIENPPSLSTAITKFVDSITTYAAKAGVPISNLLSKEIGSQLINPKSIFQKSEVYEIFAKFVFPLGENPRFYVRFEQLFKDTIKKYLEAESNETPIPDLQNQIKEICDKEKTFRDRFDRINISITLFKRSNPETTAAPIEPSQQSLNTPS